MCLLALNGVTGDEMLSDTATQTGTRPHFFEKLYAGNFNRLALFAAEQFLNAPDLTPTVLGIYGQSGTGKTSLLLAIQNHLIQSAPALRVRMLDCSDFISIIFQAFQSKKLADARESLSECDFLLVDNVQLLSDKIGSQEEFHHIASKMLSLGKRVIFSCDVPPSVFCGIEPRLTSLLEGGIVIQITPPNTIDRIGIINKKLNELGLPLDSEVVHFLANQIKPDIRKIEGVIHSISIYLQSTHYKLTLESIQALAPMLDVTRQVHHENGTLH